MAGKATVALAAFVLLAVGVTIGPLRATGEPSGLPDIVAKSITIKGKEGKGSVTIRVTDQGPGVWLTNPNGDYICICALDDGVNHTMYLMKKDHTFGDIGLSMAPDGSGQIQFRDSKGKPRFLPLEKLADLPLDKLIEGVK